MSQETQPNSTPPNEIKSGNIDMDAFRAEISSLTAVRRAAIKEFEEFSKQTLHSLSEQGITGTEADREMRRLWRTKNRKSFNMLELAGVNSDKLTEEDAKMWRDVKNYKKGSITRKEFEKYSKDVETSGNTDSGNLRAVMANKLVGIWLKEELDEMN